MDALSTVQGIFDLGYEGGDLVTPKFTLFFCKRDAFDGFVEDCGGSRYVPIEELFLTCFYNFF